MFNAIRNFITSVTSSTIVRLSTQVTELEECLSNEMQYTGILLDRNIQLIHRVTDAEKQIANYQDAVTALYDALDDKTEELEKADSCYRSVLHDWTAQRNRISELEKENALLKKRLELANDLNQHLTDLNDVTYKGYEVLRKHVTNDIKFVVKR